MSDAKHDSERFQPGQLGLAHLLGVMAVVSVVAALSAARLRTLPPMRAGEVVIHWVLVAAIAAAFYGFKSLRRRRERQAAGQVLLRVSARPMSDSRRKLISWLLLAAVVADGVLMSVFVLPEGFLTLGRLGGFNLNMLYVLVGQGLLWRFTLDHWLTNIYSVEFCEHGIVTYGQFFPWPAVTRVAWSPARPNNLVIGANRTIHELTIDPAAREAVSEFLAGRRA